eukprot:5837925-Amphidinium_carterae.1
MFLAFSTNFELLGRKTWGLSNPDWALWLEPLLRRSYMLMCDMLPASNVTMPRQSIFHSLMTHAKMLANADVHSQHKLLPYPL